MINPQIALVFLGVYADKVIKFDYKRLIPQARVEKYSYGVVGVELTAPWGANGLGIGFGLGVVDLWLGWPRLEENLHTADCKHESPVRGRAQVKELHPVDS